MQRTCAIKPVGFYDETCAYRIAKGPNYTASMITACSNLINKLTRMETLLDVAVHQKDPDASDLFIAPSVELPTKFPFQTVEQVVENAHLFFIRYASKQYYYIQLVDHAKGITNQEHTVYLNVAKELHEHTTHAYLIGKKMSEVYVCFVRWLEAIEQFYREFYEKMAAELL